VLASQGKEGKNEKKSRTGKGEKEGNRKRESSEAVASLQKKGKKDVVSEKRTRLFVSPRREGGKGVVWRGRNSRSVDWRM